MQLVGEVCCILYSNGNFGFHVSQGTHNFQRIPQEQFIHFQGFFLGTQKIILTFG